MKTETLTTMKPAGSGPPNAPGAAAPEGTGTGAVALTVTAPAAPQRKYTLSPQTQTMPRRVEKMLLRSMKMRARAGAMFGEAAELLLRAINETRGSSREKCIVPGIVYAFSQPASIDGKLKSTVQIVDNFAAPEVTKVTRVSRWDVKSWKGDGPARERPAREAANAGQTFEEGDELP